jgi:sodium transport system permease protein
MSALEMGPPPLETLGWLMIVLIPIAALFSALSLALAAMARSSKEGQYYLMPLMLGTMPLMLLPMLPAVELDLGNSLIPVTGVILLLRALIEGQYLVALHYVLPVATVTGICCWLAIQWAIHQFQDEKVLFHESEQFDPRSWLLHLIRNRQAVPTVAQAFLCGVLLLLVRFFAAFVLPVATGWSGFVSQTLVVQVVLIAGPPLLMALLLTRSPAQTLLLRLPRLSHVIAVALLAMALHPVASALTVVVHQLYPLSEQTLAQLEPLQAALGEASATWQVLALLALLPAICEELAFRGFILSGLRRMKDPAMAVLVSSLFFGIAHPVLQQSLTAFVVGLVIGYISIKTRSILPCMLFHFLHNALLLSSGKWAADPSPWWSGLVEVTDPGLVAYAWPLVIMGATISALILLWFHVQDRPLRDHALLASPLRVPSGANAQE